MKNKNYDTIKEEIYIIINQNGSVDCSILKSKMQNNMMQKHLISELKQDRNLQFYQYKNGKYVFCKSVEFLFYKPMIR